MTKVLVIDDSNVIKVKITSILEMEGYEVIAAEDGKLGIHLAKSHLPDLILCDIMMPEVDGYQVFQELKKHQETSTIPFLFLTAKADKSDLRVGMSLGADDYLTKPFEIDDLLKAVDTQLKKKQTRDFLTQKSLEELRTNLSLTLPHELITPLTGILETTNQLKSVIQKLPDKSVQNMLEHIESSGNTLQQHIENFVLFTRLEIIAQNPEEVKNVQKARIDKPKEIIREHIIEKASRYDFDGDIVADIENVTIKINEIYFIKLVSEMLVNFIKMSKKVKTIIIKSEKESENIYIHIEPKNKDLTLSLINSQPESNLGMDIIKKITQVHGGDFNIQKKDSFRMTAVLPIESFKE